jgi:hypothetical protein
MDSSFGITGSGSVATYSAFAVVTNECQKIATSVTKYFFLVVDGFYGSPATAGVNGYKRLR